MIYVTAFDGMGSGEDSTGGALQNLAGIEASDIMHIANDFLASEGVLDANASGDFEASADGTNMQIDVLKGVAYVKNDAWVKATSTTKFWRVESDGTEIVTLDAADASQDRIDLIILQVNDAAVADDEASNVATITKVTGTPAAVPVAPTMPDDAIELAQVEVAASVTTISNTDITDSRLSAKVDGALVTSVLLENNAELQAKTTGGTAINIAKMNATDQAEYGDTSNSGTKIVSGGDINLEPASGRFKAPYSRFSVGPSTSQVIGNKSFTKVQFNTAAVNKGSNFVTASNRYVAPVAGVLQAYAGLQYQAAPDGTVLFVLFYKNGSEIYAGSVSAGGAGNQGPSVAASIELAAGDYVEVYCWQDSGGNLSLSSNVARVFFTGLFLPAVN